MMNYTLNACPGSWLAPQLLDLRGWSRQQVGITRCIAQSSGRSKLAQPLPRHVAIIMDGNGRYAEEMGQPPISGHRAGVAALRGVLNSCLSYGIPFLTVYAFSADNWRRSSIEVSLLMDLIERLCTSEMETLIKKGIRVRFIGSSAQLSPRLRAGMHRLERGTAGSSALQVTVALGYSGRADIVAAARRAAALVRDGALQVSEITEAVLAEGLATAVLPGECREPDLLIRTSGEQRLSGFLLWELAYTELFFAPELWPAFSPATFDAALAFYAGRQRRFGARR